MTSTKGKKNTVRSNHTERHPRGEYGYTPQQSTPKVRRTIFIGFMVLVVMVGGFGGWAALSQLDAAAIAEGRLTVQNQVKAVQHLEGGIVKNLHVKEGDWVKRDQRLITLDDTQASARLALVRVQAHERLAELARLIAERDEKVNIEFPNALLQRASFDELKHILQGQLNIFLSNRENIKTTTDILRNRIAQLEDEIRSLQAQIKSANRQLTFIEEELIAMRYLDAKGLIEKPRLLAIEREKARLQGEVGEHTALIARAQQQIGETKIQIVNTIARQRNETLTQLRDTQRELADLLERERAAEDVMKRLIIQSPIFGRVVDLKVHTIGGVIGPREVLMTIVPAQDNLIIEARINPLDIDVVKNGLKAKVQMSAYKARHIPQLDAVVTHVSGDVFTDERTAQTYYIAHVQINQDQLKLIKDLKLYQGMPAQVMIITDKRTPLEYFWTPIKDSLNRAFREE